MARREGREELLRFSKDRCLKLREELAFSFKSAGSWSTLYDMLKRRGYELQASGRGVRLTRGIHYAKLSDVLPPKLSMKRLTERWGRFSEFWARKQGKPQKRRRKQKSIQQQLQK